MAKPNVLSKLLDDLTHLEINTILKDGMTSAPQPEEMEEVLYVLLSNYKQKLKVILKRNEVAKPVDEDSIHSYQDLYKNLDALNKFMDAEETRLIERDYILFLRMKSFCNYLGSRSEKISLVKRNGAPEQVTVYTANMKEWASFKLDMNDRDKVMIKRLYDLGTERIVMQTRFGIDGDVVTRIEESLANNPRQVVVDFHEKHTDLSVKYWQSLVTIVRDIFNGSK